MSSLVQFLEQMGEKLRQLQQVRHTELGAAFRKFCIFIRLAQISPLNRHLENAAIFALEDQHIPVPSYAITQNQKRLTAQRIERMGDPNTVKCRIGCRVKG